MYLARKELMDYPERDGRDFGYRVTRATVGVVPYIGPPLQEILDMTIGAPLARRQAEWSKSLAETIQDICNRIDGLSPEQLGQNEEFLNVVAAATEIAMKNHRQEKLEALRNIVAHTAEGIELNEVLRNTFLSLVDRFSPIHLSVLRLHSNPSSSPKITARVTKMEEEMELVGNFRHLLRAALTDCSVNVLDQIESDLVSEKLIKEGVSTQRASLKDLMNNSHVTPRGDAFLKFIS